MDVAVIVRGVENSPEKWYIEQRLPDRVCCPPCGSQNVQTGSEHKIMPFRRLNNVGDRHSSTKTAPSWRSP